MKQNTVKKLLVFCLLIILALTTVSIASNTTASSTGDSTVSSDITSAENTVNGIIVEETNTTADNVVVSNTNSTSSEPSNVVSSGTDLGITDATDMTSSDGSRDSEDTENNIEQSFETNYVYTSNDLFLFDTDIEMSDIVDGNVFAYGSTVKITGEIYGDLFVVANTLEIAENAVIYGNIFTYATNLKLAGIASDMYAMSDSFSMEKTAIIARNFYLSSNEVSLSGTISRDAYISTNNMNFVENEEPIIEGNLNYTSENEIHIPDGIVGGTVSGNILTADTGNMVWSIVVSIIRALIFAFVIIMLSIWIAPKFSDKVCEIVSKKSFQAFGIGLLAFFGIIILAFILFVFTAGFGASIAIFVAGLLILAYSIANVVFSMSIGKFIANKLKLNKTVYFVLFSLAIVLVLELVSLIPTVGFAITFITSIIGIGILCINAYKRKDLVNKEEK